MSQSFSSGEAQLPLRLPPTEFMRNFAASLGASRLILDAGCDTGKHGSMLAEHGHIVVAVDTEFESLRAASQIIRDIGALTGKCILVNGDIRNLPFTEETFDAVINNEVLHQMRKPESRIALDTMRLLTKRGGLNAVSGYLVEPNTANPVNNARCFQPGELLGSYEGAQWEILAYRETILPIQHKDREYISSKAEIVARKPHIPDEQ